MHAMLATVASSGVRTWQSHCHYRTILEEFRYSSQCVETDGRQPGSLRKLSSVVAQLSHHPFQHSDLKLHRVHPTLATCMRKPIPQITIASFASPQLAHGLIPSGCILITIVTYLRPPRTVAYFLLYALYAA